MDTLKQTLNRLLVGSFNEILKIEEHALQIMTGNKLTVNEVHTLEAIGMDSADNMGEVANTLHITVSTLTIAINRLVRKGYVERMRPHEDRRVVRLRLTDSGREAVCAHSRFHERLVQATVERLDEGEKTVLLQCVENLHAFFREEAKRLQSERAALEKAGEKELKPENLLEDIVE